MSNEPYNTPPQDADPAVEHMGKALPARGSHSSAQHRVRSLAPWAVSLVAHAGLVLIGFVVTWTVVMMQSDEAPAIIVADFYANQYDPVTNLPTEQSTTNQPHQGQPDRQAIDDLLAQTSSPIDVPVGELLAGPSDRTLADAAPDARGAANVTFVGVRSTNARRIVYVIDGSGSMIRTLPIVLKELANSLDLLSAQQSFGIIFFQRNEAVIVPPAGRLTPARADERLAALSWIGQNIHPQGRSNPIKAIEAALALKPDVIFMLSENITGSGQFEIDQKDLLALLEKLNPRDAATKSRPAQINCIQFLDPDPLDTLRKIAAAHGGPDGYRFLSRSELGLGTP